MAFDIQYVLWSAYKSLHVDITDPTTGASVYDLPTSIKNYKNTVATRIGVQYHACKFVTARLGMYVDESPVRSDFLNPETPSMTKVSYTAGVTINPAKCIDRSGIRIYHLGRPGAGRDRATTTIHSLTKRSMHRHTGSSSQAEWPRSKRKSRLIPRQTTRRSSLFRATIPCRRTLSLSE